MNTVVVARNSSGNLILPPTITPVRIVIVPVTVRGRNILRGTGRIYSELGGVYHTGVSTSRGSPK